MRSYRAPLAVLAAAVVQTVVASPATAQVGSVLIGKVSDRATGQGLPGVQVVVTSNSLQGEQTVETDSTGSYRLPNLPAGSYTVQFFVGGYKPFTNPAPIVLRTGQTIRFNAPLLAEGAQEIEVVVEAPSVDVGSSSSGSSLDEAFIQKVPVAAPTTAPGKSFEAVAVATPGAQADQYGTSIAGTTSPENGYRVDGVSVGNPAFGTNGSGISMEFLSEVQVISGGYMPEYGRSTGGTISATTRSGSNEMHGSVWISGSPGGLEGQRARIQSDASAIITQRKLHHVGDMGARLDGPIIQDKLWFMAGVQVARQSYKLNRSVWARELDPQGNPILDTATELTKRKLVQGSEQNLRTMKTELQAIGKLTYGIDSDNRISLTAFYTPNWTGNSNKYLDNNIAINNTNLNGQQDAFSRARTGAATDVNLRWLSTADNKRWSFDTNLAMHRERHDDLPRDGSRIGDNTVLQNSPNVSWGFDDTLNLTDFEPNLDRNACTTVGPDGVPTCDVRNYQTGGPGQITQKLMYRYQLRHTTSRSFIFAGHHTAKAGVDLELTTYRHKKAYTGLVALQDRRGAGKGFAEFRRYGVLVGPDKAVSVPHYLNNTSMRVVGAFLQDSWSIMDKVTLNAGVRYDGAFIYGSDGRRFISLPLQFAPRLGVIWDPTQKGKSKLFVQYARYYQGMSLDIADRSGSLESSASTTRDPQACLGLKDNPTDTDACLKSRDANNSFGDKGANVGFNPNGAAKTPIDPNLKAQSSGEISAGAEYNVLPSAKIGLYYQKRWLNDIIEDVSRDEASTYFIANPGRGIASEFPRGQRRFDAFQIAFTKTYKNHWLGQASYQWSKTRGNISGLFRPESGQLDPNINSDFDLMSLLDNRVGYLDADRRHEFKLYAGGDYPLNERISLDGGMAFDARSGKPTNYLGTHQIYGPAQSFLLQRGSGERLPWQYNVNLNLGAVLRVGQKGRLRAGIEIFNITNAQTPISINQVYATDDGIKPIKGATDPSQLVQAVDKLAAEKAAEANTKSGATDPTDPKFVTVAEKRRQILNPSFGNATAYQEPRNFRFSIRYDF